MPRGVRARQDADATPLPAAVARRPPEGGPSSLEGRQLRVELDARFEKVSFDVRADRGSRLDAPALGAACELVVVDRGDYPVVVAAVVSYLQMHRVHRSAGARAVAVELDDVRRHEMLGPVTAIVVMLVERDPA